MWASLRHIIFSNEDPCVWDWGPPTGPAHYRISEEGVCIIGTSLTDMAVDSLGTLDQSKLSTSWQTVCCATQSRRKVEAQQLQKCTVKATKPITLPPFSTTVVKGHTKLKDHDMRLNLIAECSEINQLPPSVQCTPTYYNLEPGSNRVTAGLRNVSAKQITIPSRVVVCKV